MASNFNEESATRKNEEYEGPRINGVAQKFLADLNEERERLGSEFPLCVQVIDEGISSK